MFLAHESEIPTPGDYVVRRIVDDSFIVCRDEAGAIRVLFNMCLHRGMQVCRSELGNTSHFRCPYHAWTYKNTGELIGVPFHGTPTAARQGLRREGVGAAAGAARRRLRRADLRLARRARADLEDYLGDFRFFLDFYLGQSEAGAEAARPAALRGQVELEDRRRELLRRHLPHAPHPRRASSTSTSSVRRRPASARRARSTSLAAAAARPTSCRPRLPEQPRAHRLSRRDDRRAWSAPGRPSTGPWSVTPASCRRRRRSCPNLSFVHNWPKVNADGLVVPFVSIRLWQPVSADRDRGALVVRRRSRRARMVQGGVLQGVPHVLRLLGHVRAGRRRELDLDHRRWPEGRWPSG